MTHSPVSFTTSLQKMRTSLPENSIQPVSYYLALNEDKDDLQEIHMNELIGRRLTISYQGEIHCQHCGRKTKKSFAQGYCYPCFTKLPQCDQCIMSPEKCHYDQGTCRDPQWGERFCMQDHYVYLANSSGVKVGITRGTQIPTRWIDQGAIQALPIFRVATRRLSGLIETLYKEQVADKTNWRAMLKGQVDTLDLKSIQQELFEQFQSSIEQLKAEYGEEAIEVLDEQSIEINYPVSEYPTKIVSMNLDKTPEISGTLMGIKAQYLIFDTGVINIRKFSSYKVTVEY